MVPRVANDCVLDILFSYGIRQEDEAHGLWAELLAAAPQAPGADKGEAMELLREARKDANHAAATGIAFMLSHYGTQTAMTDYQEKKMAELREILVRNGAIDALLNPEKE